jgi:hypothetical protein
MNTYKIKARMLIDVEWEVEAENEDQAFSEFFATDARDVIDEGRIMDVNTEDEEAELVEGTFKVKTTHIDYDIGFGDVCDSIEETHPEVQFESEEFDELVEQEIDRLKNSLPQELDLEVTCAPEDLDDYVADAVSEETNWLVNSVEYKIIEGGE